jgi:hypothetical protein
VGLALLVGLVVMLAYRYFLKEPVLRIKVIGRPAPKADIEKAELIDRNIEVFAKALKNLYRDDNVGK